MPRGREIRRCLFARALKRIGVHSRLRGGFENGAVLVNHCTRALTSSSWRNCATPCATPVYTNFHRYSPTTLSPCVAWQTREYLIFQQWNATKLCDSPGFSHFPSRCFNRSVFRNASGLGCSLPSPWRRKNRFRPSKSEFLFII